MRIIIDKLIILMRINTPELIRLLLNQREEKKIFEAVNSKTHDLIYLIFA